MSKKPPPPELAALAAKVLAAARKPSTDRVKAPCTFVGKPVPPPNGKPSEKRWSLCEHPAQPLGNAVCPCEGCGPRCGGYSIATPDRVTRVNVSRVTPPGDGRLFNCSLIDHGGKRLLAYRSGWSGSNIFVAELGAGLLGGARGV